MRKHSVVVAGHATSVSLEDVFWKALQQEAEHQCCSLAELIAHVDTLRKDHNLSSALRVYLFHQRRNA